MKTPCQIHIHGRTELFAPPKALLRAQSSTPPLTLPLAPYHALPLTPPWARPRVPTRALQPSPLRSARQRRRHNELLAFIPLLSILILLFPSCKHPAAPGSQQQALKATLTIGFERPRARSFAPADLSIASLVLKASGPNGALVELNVDPGKLSASLELAPGTWSLSAEGLSKDAAIVAKGALDLSLGPAEARNAVLVLLPMGGKGNLAISWTIVGSLETGATVEGRLVPARGDPIILSSLADALSMAALEVDSGPYTLELKLISPSGPLCGLAEAILVAADMETKASLVFEPPEARMALSIAAPDFDGPVLAILPSIRRVAPGVTAFFEARGENSGQGAWYVDGSESAETSSSLGLTGGEAYLKARVDRIAKGSEIAYGSASALLRVGEAYAAGPLVWAESLERDESGMIDGLKALGDCRDLAFSASGDCIALVGKDSGALSFLRFEGAGSVFAEPFLSAADRPELLNPTRVKAHPSGSFLIYSEDEGSICSIAAPVLNGVDRAETLGYLADTGLKGATDFILSPDGSQALFAVGSTDALWIAALDADSAPLSASRAAGKGDPGLEQFSKPLALALSADGSRLAVGTAGDDALYIFIRDTATGNLGFSQRIDKAAILPLASLSDPCALAFAPDGSSLFVLSYYGKSLIRFDFSAASGAYSATAASKSGINGVAGFDYPKRLAVHPGRNLVAISGSGASDGIALFDTRASASLSFIDAILPGSGDASILKPLPLAFSPDGAWLAAASAESEKLGLYWLIP